MPTATGEATKVLQCGDLPATLKERIAADATEQGMSINDVVVGALAAAFELEFEGTGRRSPGFRGSLKGAFRMPVDVWRAISEESHHRKMTGTGAQAKRDIVTELLVARYGA